MLCWHHCTSILNEHAVRFRKWALGHIFFTGPFWGAYFGGAYIQRGLSTEGNLRFKIDWASLIFGSKFTVLDLFYFVFEGIFPSTSPRGGLYLKGRFNGRFFALPVWGAYIWRGLYMEGLIFGILRYIENRFSSISKHFYNRHCLVLKDLRENKNKSDFVILLSQIHTKGFHSLKVIYIILISGEV